MEIYEILPGKLYQSPSIDREFEYVLQKGINVIIDMVGREDMVDIYIGAPGVYARVGDDLRQDILRPEQRFLILLTRALRLAR